ncbi:hypothetical protein GCM10022267_78020 [Lentzea roselyniae]|uniref:Uncharacterized protein n=1 Tax=Lentzea roselyniae TaxID=531940 RepID=A0ABP7C684_9PSEU
MVEVDARVVDQDVEPAELLDRLADDLLGLAGTEIALHGDVTVSWQVRGDCFRRGRVGPEVDGDPVALVREGVGDGGTDAARGSGDECVPGHGTCLSIIHLPFC